MNQRRSISLAIACLLLGCSPEWVERSVQVKFDPQSTDFWDMPLPTDLRRQDSGSYGVSNWPNNSSNGYLEMWLDTIDRRLLDGWGVSSGVFTPLSGPIAPETLPQSPEASMLLTRAFFSSISKKILRVAESESPWTLASTRKQMPGPLRITSPGIPSLGSCEKSIPEYALVITDKVTAPDGTWVGRSEAFHRASLER